MKQTISRPPQSFPHPRMPLTQGQGQKARQQPQPQIPDNKP